MSISGDLSLSQNLPSLVAVTSHAPGRKPLQSPPLTEEDRPMTKYASEAPVIVPREKLDFDLEGDIPQYWFGGDAFKTRYFDAMSTIFPEGEGYFISCVRAFRDRIQDKQL